MPLWKSLEAWGWMSVTFCRRFLIYLPQTLRSLVAFWNSWFHAEETSRNDTGQRLFYTSANYTVVASPTDAKTASAPARAAKSGFM